MSKASHLGTTLSALAVATMLAGCAAPMARQSSVKRTATVDKSDVALGLRAQAAVTAGDFASAIDFAERAVEKSPQDATVRAILANAYFGAGRFASAESAYRDSLSLDSNQAPLYLKLALVQIAQGKNRQAIAMLESVRGGLEAADYGLALALAGQPGQAIEILESAARRTGADARVRQNLALAYGFSGNWDAARTVAGQDLPANLVDSRIQHWMMLAKPIKASDQVASLVGVTPAPVDPGQPVRLALNGAVEQQAQAALQQVPETRPVAAVPEYRAEAFAEMTPAPMPEQASPDPVFAPVPAVQIASAPAVDAPVVKAEDIPPVMAAIAPVIAPTIRPVQSRAVTASRGDVKARFAASAAPASSAKAAPVVVQIGAYSSASRVETAWDQAADRFAALSRYQPTSARFQSEKGTVYRLAVKGFANISEAKTLCATLQKQGRSCFVRRADGDSPVQFASR